MTTDKNTANLTDWGRENVPRFGPRISALLSAPDTDAGIMQRHVLARILVHRREGMIPTNARFIFYELEPKVVNKTCLNEDGTLDPSRRPDRGVSEALTALRKKGLVAWEEIEDETRQLEHNSGYPSIAEGAITLVPHITLDRWGGKPAPLILCESRSLMGTLRPIAQLYGCPITATNGQCAGHLVTEVAPSLQADQHVAYFGDKDKGGGDIETANHQTLLSHAIVWRASVEARNPGFTYLHENDLWERVALTDQQIEDNQLTRIQKLDRRCGPIDQKTKKPVGEWFEAVETEAFGQANIIAALRAWLDELMLEPLETVLEHERVQREQVAEVLRQALGGGD